MPLDSLLPLVPQILHSPLRSSRYCAARTQTLVIQSEESRKQAANVDACFEKLHQLLETTAKDLVPGETSAEKKDRVKKLYVPTPIRNGYSHITGKKLETSLGSKGRKCTAVKRVVDEGVATTDVLELIHN